MEIQTAVLDLMTDLRQRPNTPEQNVSEHLSREKFNQRSHNHRSKDHSREKKRKRNQEAGKKKKIMYVGNLHENMTERDLVELFGLWTTNYLLDNCSIEMSKLRQNERHNSHTFVLAPCHVCDELVKLHGFEFHGRKVIIEEAKTPPRTLLYKLSTSAVANYQQNMHKMSPTINDVMSRLPAAPIEEQSPIQKINSAYSKAVIPKKKNIALFSGSTPRGMKMKHLNSQVKEGRIHLKVFPVTKANQLNHYIFPTLEEFDHDCAIIHVTIILRSKDMSELKEIPKKIVKNRTNLSTL